MPTYEYECQACGHVFEKFQSITARPVKTCPSCGARRARRLIGTGAGIIFKGSGFHATDYRSQDYKEAARKEASAVTAGSSSKDGSQDSGKKDSGTKDASASKSESKK